jgi:hypothetical protein
MTSGTGPAFVPDLYCGMLVDARNLEAPQDDRTCIEEDKRTIPSRPGEAKDGV